MDTTNVDTSPWLLRGDAARRARVSERQIDRWIAAGRLPAYREGRIVRVHVDDLDAFLRPHLAAGAA